LFPVPPHPAFIGVTGLAACALVGIAAGALAALLTHMVYWADDVFARLPIHWMWWPPIGGLVVGLGGWIFPTALGVGYGTIGALLQGREAMTVVIGILLVKSIIWSVSLGSGTSGGVLAPLLMIGGALGALASPVLPAAGAGFWPLVCMAAVLGGTTGAPLTAVIFGLELTHDFNALVPLLLATVLAHAFTVLVLPRSILTEKVARRGVHLSREYEVDPLEILLVRDVMDYASPVVEEMPSLTISHLAPLRVAAYRMAESGTTRLQVIDPDDAGHVIGHVTVAQLLKARVANLDAENRRERHLWFWPATGTG
ncbi:MAG: chloride channel protein, partial [Gemmatimonadaceae bacterium]